MGGALWRVDVSSTRRCPCERGCGPEAGIVPTELCSARRRSWMVRPSHAFNQSRADVAAGERILCAARNPEDDAPREALRFAAQSMSTNRSRPSGITLRFFGVALEAVPCGRRPNARSVGRGGERRECRGGTDVMMSTYARAIPASTIFECSTACRPSRNC